MKLISWNVNGLRAVMNKGNLIPFINKENPDIMAFDQDARGSAEFQF